VRYKGPARRLENEQAHLLRGYKAQVVTAQEYDQRLAELIAQHVALELARHRPHRMTPTTGPAAAARRRRRRGGSP
jgi:hypothetical protein